MATNWHGPNLGFNYRGEKIDMPIFLWRWSRRLDSSSIIIFYYVHNVEGW